MSLLLKRTLHVSTPRPFLPPWLLPLAKPLSRFAALFAGRKLRNWYKKLPEENKAKFKDTVRKNRRVLFKIATGFVGFVGYLYYIHLETCPVTGRRRFVALQANQMEKVSDREFKDLLDFYGGQILPAHHPSYAKVGRVANRIIEANKAEFKVLGEKEWTVTVVDDPMANAMVLPVSELITRLEAPLDLAVTRRVGIATLSCIHWQSRRGVLFLLGFLQHFPHFKSFNSNRAFIFPIA